MNFGKFCSSDKDRVLFIGLSESAGTQFELCIYKIQTKKSKLFATPRGPPEVASLEGSAELLTAKLQLF